MANALSSDSVIRVVYEMSRILNALLSSQAPPYVKIEKREQGEVILITPSDEYRQEPLQLYGSIAKQHRINQFLGEASSDTRSARSVAAYAMYLAADSTAKGASK
jgi:CRISPR type I-A-associated protein Csa5